MSDVAVNPTSSLEDLTPLEREIIAEAARAARACNLDVAVRTPAAIRDALVALLQSQELARFRELIDEHQRLDAGARSFDLQGVTIGIEFEVALGFGAKGSFGVGCPPGNWKSFTEYIIYVRGVAEVGIVVGGLFGIVIGLYKILPTALAGGAYAWAIELGSGEEIEVEGIYSKDEETPSNLLGYTVAEAAGEEEGADGEYSYTWIFDWDAPLAYQPRAANYMVIQSITCNQPSESGHDEVFFTFKPDDVYTYTYPTQGNLSMGSGDVWNAGRSIWFNDSVAVELWDSDGPSNDDSLGSVTYSVSGFQSVATVSGSGGSYTIRAVLNPPVPPFSPIRRINTVATSALGQAACAFNSQSLLAWKGSGNTNVYYSASANGQPPWPGSSTVTGASTAISPAAVELNGELFVFWRNTNINWATSPNGMPPWGAVQTIPGEQAQGQMSACVLNGALYLFWSDQYEQALCYSTYDPARGAFVTPAPGISTPPPAVATGVASCVFDGKIYLFWRDPSTTHVMVSASASAPWPAAVPCSTNETTATAPAACVHDGSLFVFYVDPTTQTVRFMSSQTGTSWSAGGFAGGTLVTSMPPAVLAGGDGIDVFLTQAAGPICVSSGNPS
jgi:hypothetical protein